jgi:hypothetical protein
MKILARLADPDYGKRYREGIYINGASLWEWGMGDDKFLYCRDLNQSSILKVWVCAKNLKLRMDLETMNRLQAWNDYLIENGTTK